MADIRGAMPVDIATPKGSTRSALECMHLSQNLLQVSFKSTVSNGVFKTLTTGWVYFARVSALLLTTLLILTCWRVDAQSGPTLFEAKACLSIGNIKGEGPCTCESDGGHDFGKGGRQFKRGDKPFILCRFRNLSVGSHTVKARTYKRDQNGKYVWQKTYDKTVKFSNKIPDWAFWFPAAAHEPGSWKVEIFLDNLPWFGKDKDIVYSFDMPLE